MPTEWTVEQVLALAPDPASGKAGQGLGARGKWASLGRGEGLLWGECKGSGANPYQTKVDPDGPAFSCSCPSRKFPCKHALGLMLVWASGPGAIAEAATPAWVVSWQEGRAKRAEKAKEKAERGPAPVDPVAQAKRESARAAKVAGGLDDLSLWLGDLVRQGFASLSARSASLWDDQARRMVDAQAPGVARRLRQIDAMPFAGDGWQAALLDRLARLHLLNEGYRRLPELPPEVAEDVRATIGFPADLDAIRSGPGIRDRWQVVGQAAAVEDRLTVLRTWLVGRDTGRPALVLDFAAGGKPLDASLPPGVVVDAEVAFFPGSAPLRALVKERQTPPEPLGELAGGTPIAGAFAAYGAALARNPWIELVPVILNDVVLEEREGAWRARDGSGAVLPLSKRFGRGWHLLALGGGGPITLTGEFDGATLEPLGVRAGGRFHPIPMKEGESLTLSSPPGFPLLAEATASAVVGVDRRPPPATEGVIGRAMAGVEEREPASRLLAVAAAASLYGRSGRKPAVDPSPLPPPCPPDDRPECPPEAARRLRTILGGEQVGDFAEWVGLCAGSGRRLPHESIVEALEAHHRHPIPAEPLRVALGERGRWLAARNPAWRNLGGDLEFDDPAAVWAEGHRQERLLALKYLLRTDPAGARALVGPTFARESADDRAAIVQSIGESVLPEDEPFLESALDDRGKDVRLHAAEALRRLPGSALVGRMIERARAALRWERGMLGLGSGKLVVEPPAACDKAMIRDGIVAKPPPHSGLGERAWWLRQVVAAVPPPVMSEILGVPAQKAVAASKDGDWELELWFAWADAAIRSRDVDWAEALLGSSPEESNPRRDPSQDHKLFALLPPDRRDAFLLRVLKADPGPFGAKHPALRFLWMPEIAIGPAPAREILRRLRTLIDKERRDFDDDAQRAKVRAAGGTFFDHKYHDHQVAMTVRALAQSLLPDLADEAAAGVELGEPPRCYYAEAYSQMIDRLRFRRDMHREFAP